MHGGGAPVVAGTPLPHEYLTENVDLVTQVGDTDASTTPKRWFPHTCAPAVRQPAWFAAFATGRLLRARRPEIILPTNGGYASCDTVKDRATP
jgi:hypothetical protein